MTRMMTVEECIENLLDVIHPGWAEVPDMVNTPLRVAKMWQDILTPQEFKMTVFDNSEDDGPGYDQIILQSNIPFYGTCSHHLLPFIGKAHVAYIPNMKIVGLSKLTRLVRNAGRRLGTQEEMTQDAGLILVDKLDPIAAAVIIEAEHMCMRMRGVQEAGVITKTSFMDGAFRDKPEARAELMAMING